MSSRRAMALLTVLALWPLAQHGLARRLDANPWKLGGFAMYTTPAPPLEIGWIEVGASGPRRLDPAVLPKETREELRDFERRRHALGRLVDPEPVARRVLARRPEAQAVMVVIRRYELDPGTARFRMDETRTVVGR
ncbi:MAG: hypothetical protein QNK05_10755 [Myxococcota bacterium]|nr:hypothetical protein [Myxococcota bacterium]